MTAASRYVYGKGSMGWEPEPDHAANNSRVLDPLSDAITVLENMRVTTQPMRADEMTDIEQRRITALDYLRMERDRRGR